MLKGEKVVLRALQEEDFEAWYRMNDDVDLTLSGTGRWVPVSIDIARERWQYLLHSSPEVRVNFGIEVADEFIGMLSIKEIDRHNQHALLSIALSGPVHIGRGYGRDALRVVLRWAFQIHNLHRIELETWATNERALRAYRAAGFVEEGRLRDAVWLDGQFVDVVIMSAIRPEWLQNDQVATLKAHAL
ncbi:MAG: GNAT family N-acetyltransferase [Herpetosiphonaceae bacterium]|nr:GNAT family N-acetyltransferase [Herpetosiphonaceae bacterium]